MSRSQINTMIHSDDDDDGDDDRNVEEKQQPGFEDKRVGRTSPDDLSTSLITPAMTTDDPEQDKDQEKEPISKEPFRAQAQLKSVGEELSGMARLKNQELKIQIRFQPVGSTPLISPRVFKISATQTMASLAVFLRRRLKVVDQLWLYLHSLFSPNPDERLGDLWEMFRTNDELVVYYCNTVAFG